MLIVAFYVDLDGWLTGALLPCHLHRPFVLFKIAMGNNGDGGGDATQSRQIESLPE